GADDRGDRDGKPDDGRAHAGADYDPAADDAPADHPADDDAPDDTVAAAVVAIDLRNNVAAPGSHGPADRYDGRVGGNRADAARRVALDARELDLRLGNFVLDEGEARCSAGSAPRRRARPAASVAGACAPITPDSGPTCCR